MAAPTTAAQRLVWQLGVWLPAVLAPFAVHTLWHGVFPFALRVSPRHFFPRCYVVLDGPEVAAAALIVLGLLVSWHLAATGLILRPNPGMSMQTLAFTGVTIFGVLAIEAVASVPLSHSARYALESKNLVVLEPAWRRSPEIDRGFREWVKACHYTIFRDYETYLESKRSSGGYFAGWRFDRRHGGR